jgi:tRNA-intron endonuclease
MKSKKLIVKTGFKYGAHFRVYRGDPENYHADHLVHVIPPTFRCTFPELSRTIRLAHSVRKRMMFGVVEKGDVNYIEVMRVRP